MVRADSVERHVHDVAEHPAMSRAKLCEERRQRSGAFFGQPAAVGEVADHLEGAHADLEGLQPGPGFRDEGIVAAPTAQQVIGRCPQPCRERGDRRHGARLVADEGCEVVVFQRLREMIIQARVEPKVRRKTKPSRAAKARRLDGKKRRSAIKENRRSSFDH